MILLAQHVPLWEQALPYLRTRQNDKHTLYCYGFLLELLATHPKANAETALLAMLLHDVGWSTVPEDKQLLSFGPHMRYPELRRQHELEGVRIARELLMVQGYDQTQITRVTAIIDGHDTCKQRSSLEDALVCDADKLWRYTPFGLATVGDWFGYTPLEQLELLRKWLNTRFYTPAAQQMAAGLLVGLELVTHDSQLPL